MNGDMKETHVELLVGQEIKNEPYLSNWCPAVGAPAVDQRKGNDRGDEEVPQEGRSQLPGDREYILDMPHI